MNSEETSDKRKKTKGILLTILEHLELHRLAWFLKIPILVLDATHNISFYVGLIIAILAVNLWYLKNPILTILLIVELLLSL
jgi:hypothetical protein